MSNPAEKKRLFLFLDFMRDQWYLKSTSRSGSIDTKTLLNFCEILNEHLAELTPADFSKEELGVVWNNWLSAISRSPSLDRFDLNGFLNKDKDKTVSSLPAVGSLDAPVLSAEERAAIAIRKATEATDYALAHYSKVGQRLLDLGADLQLPSWWSINRPQPDDANGQSQPPKIIPLSMSEAVFSGNRFVFFAPELIQRISDESPPANIEQGFWDKFFFKAVKNNQFALVDLAIANLASPAYLDKTGNNSLFFATSPAMLDKLLELGTPPFIRNQAGNLALETWHRGDYASLFATMLAKAELTPAQRQELSFLNFNRYLYDNQSHNFSYFQKLLKDTGLTVSSVNQNNQHSVLFESTMASVSDLKRHAVVRNLLSRKRLDLQRESLPGLSDAVLAYAVSKFHLGRRVRQTKQFTAVMDKITNLPAVQKLFTDKEYLLTTFRSFLPLTEAYPHNSLLLDILYGNSSMPGLLGTIATESQSRTSRLSMLHVDLPATPDSRFGSLGWAIMATFGARSPTEPELRLPSLNTEVIGHLLSFSAPATWPAPTPEAVGNVLDAIMHTSYYGSSDPVSPLLDHLLLTKPAIEPEKLAFLTNKLDKVYLNQETKAKLGRILMEQTIIQANAEPSAEPKQLRLRL